MTIDGYDFNHMNDLDLVILRHKLRTSNCDTLEATKLAALEVELKSRDIYPVMKAPVRDVTETLG
jgi:hypothetical protein